MHGADKLTQKGVPGTSTHIPLSVSVRLVRLVPSCVLTMSVAHSMEHYIHTICCLIFGSYMTTIEYPLPAAATHVYNHPYIRLS
jgi:hypothetical protein